MRLPQDHPTIYLMYKLREVSLKEIDRTIASYHGPAPITSQLRRFRNIVNQSDPEDIFGHLNANRLEKLLFEYAEGKELPKYLTGQGGSPDQNLFKRLRKFFSANIHHANPLAQNVDIINPNWDFDDLYTFHRTLNKLGTGAGSSTKGLVNALQKEHLRRLHPDGTKVDKFPPLTQFDPELAAAEFWINNTGNQRLVDDFKSDPESLTKRLMTLLEENPEMDPKGFVKGLNRLRLEDQGTKIDKTKQALENLAASGKQIIRDSMGRIRTIANHPVTKAAGHVARPAMFGLSSASDEARRREYAAQYEANPTPANAVKLGLATTAQGTNAAAALSKNPKLEAAAAGQDLALLGIEIADAAPETLKKSPLEDLNPEAMNQLSPVTNLEGESQLDLFRPEL